MTETVGEIKLPCIGVYYQARFDEVLPDLPVLSLIIEPATSLVVDEYVMVCLKLK